MATTPDYGLIARLSGAIYYAHTIDRVLTRPPYVVPDPHGAAGAMASFATAELLNRAAAAWEEDLGVELAKLPAVPAEPQTPTYPTEPMGEGDAVEALLAVARRYGAELDIHLSAGPATPATPAAEEPAAS